MDTKLFAIKIPKNEKLAMDYIAEMTNNPLSKMFYNPIKEAIFKKLGWILLFKIDLRNTSKLTNLNEDFFTNQESVVKTLPIIEDFVRLMLDKNLKRSFWEIFSDVELNEKEFVLHDIDLDAVAHYLGKEYIAHNGDFKELDLTLARAIFFKYMLQTYFNITAVGSINKLNQEWSTRQPMIKQFQSQILSRYLSKFQSTKIEAIKLEDVVEVAEYEEE